MVTILTEPDPGTGPGLSAAGFPSEIELPAGLIGFPELTRFDVFPADVESPFFWLRSQGEANTGAGFLLMEPAGWLQGYRLELFDEDAEWLALERETQPWVFNIVTLSSDAPGRATVNLLGPLVVRRRDGVGKQVILANHQRYSAVHPLGAGQGNPFVPDPCSS